MGARLILDEEIIAAELTPHVVIFANNLEGYGKFSQFLNENGFPCQIFASADDTVFENLRAGTVFFVSFNLNSTDIPFLVKRIEQKLHMSCIVFAESEDFQTAAKLSSAKMTQTLQYPYTQKNFLMAMQTLVRKRKESFDKELRQRQYHEKQKGVQPEAVKPSGPAVRLFTNDEAPRDNSSIVQEAAEAFTGGTTVIEGEAPAPGFSLIQEGTESNAFFVIQHEEKPVQKKAKTLVVADRVAKAHAEQTLDYSKFAEDSSVTDPNPQQTVEKAPVANRNKDHERNRQYSSLREELMSEYWAILSVVVVGTIVCGYCLYITLFRL